jgi:hypothetical protein
MFWVHVPCQRYNKWQLALWIAMQFGFKSLVFQVFEKKKTPPFIASL